LYLEKLDSWPPDEKMLAMDAASPWESLLCSCFGPALLLILPPILFPTILPNLIFMATNKPI
jgi:hypothetical protein